MRRNCSTRYGYRETRDVDVITPEIDVVLRDASRQVAKALSLPDDWLNDGPNSLKGELLEGCENRLEIGLQGQALTIRVLGRIDLIATKLYAFCDREDDFQDVLQLHPTKQELNDMYDWVLQRDASQYWPERVDSCFNRIRKKLYGKE